MAALPQVPFPLSSRMRSLLRWGDREGRYRSRSEAFMAIVTAMVGAGWSSAEAWDALTSPHNAGGDPLRTDRDGRPRRNPWAYFERAWTRAEAYVAAHPRIRDRYEAMIRLAEIRQDADRARWSGRAGTTDRAVLEALFEIAARAGRLHIAAAVRTIAGQVGCGPNTAGRSLKRLQAAGWISLVGRSTRTRAARYQLRWRERNPKEHSGFGGEADRAWDHPDTFCWGPGLGWSKARVWDLLSTEPTSTEDFADRLGLGGRAVRKHLEGLKRYRLAERVLDGWTRGPAHPAAVAEILGTTGRTQAQRDRHARDRELRATGPPRRRLTRLPRRFDPETGEVLEEPNGTVRTPFGRCEKTVPHSSSPLSDLERAEAEIRRVFGDENVEVVA